MTAALRFVLDEQLRRVLWRAIQSHNGQGHLPIDVVRVGDPPDLPLGSLDPDILVWAEREGRILISLDRRTLPGHLADHLQAGNHSPGVLLVRPSASVPDVIEYLVMAAYAAQPAEYRDIYRYIPS
jgi:hypothetical protein